MVNLNPEEGGLDLTDSQIHALFFLPIPTAILSLCGSTLVIHAIVSEHHNSLQRLWNKTGTYERLLLVMSCCDIVASTSLALEAFFTTSDLSKFSIGTPGTCRAMGALFQFSLSGMAYYCMLSYYFLLQIRFQMRNISTRAEPWMHLFGFGWPFSTAAIGAILDWYDELQFYPGCWIGEYPRGCEMDENVKCKGNIIAWSAGGGIVFIMMVSLVVNNITITRHVAKRYGRVKFNKRKLSGALSDQDATAQRVRFVATQATLYILAFFATYLWNIILRIVESMDPYPDNSVPGVYGLMVLQAFFTPIAGFFNALIFFRPRYIAVRRRYQRETVIWSIRRTLFGTQIEPTTNSSGSGGNTGKSSSFHTGSNSTGMSSHFFARIMTMTKLVNGNTNANATNSAGIGRGGGTGSGSKRKNTIINNNQCLSDVEDEGVVSEFSIPLDSKEGDKHQQKGPRVTSNNKSRRVSFSPPAPGEAGGARGVAPRGDNKEEFGPSSTRVRRGSSNTSDLHSFSLSLVAALSISTASVEPMEDYESDDDGEEEDKENESSEETTTAREDFRIMIQEEEEAGGKADDDEIFFTRLSQCGLTSSDMLDNTTSQVTIDA